MRVDSIVSINANPQPSPRTMQYEVTSSDKSGSGKSFQEHLNAMLLQTNNSTTVNQAANPLPGLLMGYFTNLRVPNKPELKLKENVS